MKKTDIVSVRLAFLGLGIILGAVWLSDTGLTSKFLITGFMVIGIAVWRSW